LRTKSNTKADQLQGRLPDLFEKLAAKYNVPNPVMARQPPTVDSSSSSGMAFSSESLSTVPSTAAAPTGTDATSPFASTKSQDSVSPKGPQSLFGSTTTALSTSAFGLSTPAAGPLFGSPVPGLGSTFGSLTTAPAFGSTAPPAVFGSLTPAPTFGSTTLPFGSAAPVFGSAAPVFGSPSPFGAPSTPGFGGAGSQTNLQQSFAGKTAREMLTDFYQKNNPGQIDKIDGILMKYSGKEEALFRNLAQKYNLDPAVFGLPPAPPVTAGFGSPPTGAFGVAAPAGFGQPSMLGGGPSPFGSGSTGGAFGQTSSVPASGSTPLFGNSSGAFGGTSFGTLAQGSTSFGGPAAPFGGSPFGSPTPFGAPRR
jgi:hypothetical protein